MEVCERVLVSLGVISGEGFRLGDTPREPIIDRGGEEGGVNTRAVHPVAGPRILMQRGVADQRPAWPDRDADQVILRPATEEPSF